MNLKERKNALLEKLESLKSDSEKKSSKTQYCFMGQCRKKHLIETSIDKNVHGIQSGDFIKLINRGIEHISVCVGIGPMCEEDPEYSPEKNVLWFLEEQYFGVTYWRTENASDVLQKNIDIELI